MYLQPTYIGELDIVLSNQTPAPSATGISYITLVVFDITDAVYGVDIASLTVLIGGVVAYSGGADQNGFTSTITEITNGYTCEFVSPSGYPSLTMISVHVEAMGLPPAFETFSETYSFKIGRIEPPYLRYYSPSDNERDIARDAYIAISVADSIAITLNTVLIYVDGLVVYNGATDTFSDLWSTSVKRTNGFNGYDFILKKTGGFDYNEVHEVRVVATNTSLLSLDKTWSFFTELDNKVFSTYSMIRRSVRDHDRNSPSLLERLLTGSGGPDDVMETRIYDRCTDLADLYDPYKIPAKFLPWLKGLVGFTRDMDIEADVAEIREVIAKAGTLWSLKGSEASYEVACKITAGRYRIQNWFDRRMQADKTFVTEMLLDYDPICLDFDNPTPSGLLWQNIGTSAMAFPASQKFAITDLPSSYFPAGVFARENQYKYLQLLDVPLDPARAGFYRITSLIAGTYLGYLDTSWVAPAGFYGASWRLWGGNSEYVTEIRVVDDGTVNRDLLKYLVDLVRPSGERVDIVYLAFLEQFEDSRYIPQWSSSGSYTLDGSKIEIAASGEILTASTFAGTWELDRQIHVRIRGKSASSVAKVYLVYEDANNNIYALINYSTGLLSVIRYNAGVATMIGSSVVVPDLYPTDYWGTDYEYRDVFRFVLIRTNAGADLKIRAYRAGTMLYEQTYASVPFTVGGIGLASSGDSTYCDLVEVLTLPASQDRVGPNP